MLCVSHNGFAEPTRMNAPAQKISEQAGDALQQNFEIVIQHLNGSDLPPWNGNIFSVSDGKSVGGVSSKMPRRQLASGNYVLMLHFDEKIPEIEALPPFTFSISDKRKTIFTLQIGKLEASEIEYGVGRTGSDFVDSDPRRGRDYVNFELPKDQPELCLNKCKNDLNCDAYSYGSFPTWRNARCWLIHGNAAITGFSPYAASGIIQRKDSPLYRLEIVTEKIDSKKQHVR